MARRKVIPVTSVTKKLDSAEVAIRNWLDDSVPRTPGMVDVDTGEPLRCTHGQSINRRCVQCEQEYFRRVIGQ